LQLTRLIVRRESPLLRDARGELLVVLVVDDPAAPLLSLSIGGRQRPVMARRVTEQIALLCSVSETSVVESFARRLPLLSIKFFAFL
jgi:hypothetical protein